MTTPPLPHASSSAAAASASTSTSDASSGFSCSRRGFLLGSALTAAGAVLAACASGGEPVSVADSEVPVGGAIIRGEWVIAQPTAGTFTAFSTVCPHAQGQISQIVEADGRPVAICPKHNSHFDALTGDIVSGPSREPMTPAQSVSHEGASVLIEP